MKLGHLIWTALVTTVMVLVVVGIFNKISFTRPVIRFVLD